MQCCWQRMFCICQLQPSWNVSSQIETIHISLSNSYLHAALSEEFPCSDVSIMLEHDLKHNLRLNEDGSYFLPFQYQNGQTFLSICLLTIVPPHGISEKVSNHKDFIRNITSMIMPMVSINTKLRGKVFTLCDKYVYSFVFSTPVYQIVISLK